MLLWFYLPNALDYICIYMYSIFCKCVWNWYLSIYLSIFLQPQPIPCAMPNKRTHANLLHAFVKVRFKFRSTISTLSACACPYISTYVTDEQKTPPKQAIPRFINTHLPCIDSRKEPEKRAKLSRSPQQQKQRVAHKFRPLNRHPRAPHKLPLARARARPSHSSLFSSAQTNRETSEVGDKWKIDRAGALAFI